MKKHKNSKVGIVNILAGVGICVLLLITVSFVVNSWGVIVFNEDGKNLVAFPVADDSLNFIVEDDLDGFQPEKDEDCTYLLSSSYGMPNPLNQHSAYAIAIDKNGFIYITNISKYGNKGMKFGKDGKFITTFGSANSPVGYPSDIDVDKDGNIYVIDRPNDVIIKYDALFNEVWQESSPSSPARLNVYSPDVGEGFVFVMDWDTYKVKKYDLSGNFIKEWPGYGTDILVSVDGVIFITDTNNNKLLKFSLDGDTLGSIDLTGIMEGPTKIDMDGAGNLYIIDKVGRLVRFDKNGNSPEELMPKGSIGGSGMAVDNEGNVYISGGTAFYKYSKTCGSIVIKKLTDPSNSLAEFSFKTNYNSGSFVLKNKGVNISGKRPNGVYEVEELISSGYPTLDISCVDPTGGTIVDNSTRKATIVLDASEIVKCTFTNTKSIKPDSPKTDFSDQ